jgi:polyisoprenoid-binding protein YceI
MKIQCVRAVVLCCSISLPLTFQAFPAEFLVTPAESSIQVAVKATVDDFTAKVERFDAKIRVAEQSIVPTSAVVSWSFDDLKTGNKKRDQEMLHWLQDAGGLKGAFTLTKCEEKNGGLLAAGELSMHGVKREISFPLTVKRQGEHLEYGGSVELDHQHFGLRRIVKFAVLKVDPLLTIRFKLAGTLEPGTDIVGE